MDASNTIPCCGLRLRDLTYSNIKNFVVDKMHANRAFSDLQVLEPQTACELVQAIINKADGVFLWAHIVVRSLLNGLRNRDTVSDLWRRAVA
jgi:hypothetical protein